MSVGVISLPISNFSIQQPELMGLRPTAKKAALFVVKLIIFPWGLYELARYALQRLIMIPLYPAQSRIVKCFFSNSLGEEALKAKREEEFNWLRSRGYICKHLTFVGKDGNRYSAVSAAHRSTINNGRWVLQAGGNGEPVEHMLRFAPNYQQMSLNFLAVNGPGVGWSEGTATPETMADAQEAALRFLEEITQAKTILIAGRSLGGAAVGQMVLNHEFKSDIGYTVCRQMSMDRISNVAAKLVAKIGREIGPRAGWVLEKLEGSIKRLIIWSGCEIDSVAASKKLQKAGIQEIIVQAGTPFPNRATAVGDFTDDGPITPTASLGRALIEDGITANKHFILLSTEDHMTDDAINCLQHKMLPVAKAIPLMV